MSFQKYLYQNYLQATKDLSAPFLVLDLDQLDQNISTLIKRSSSKKIRIASKSIRSLDVLTYLQEKLQDHYQGIMCFRLEEALMLFSRGQKDLLLGYPVVDKKLLEKILMADAQEEITLMVDLSYHLDLLEEIGKKFQKKFKVCLDIDLSLDLPFLHFGVWRSSLRSPQDLKILLAHLKNLKWVELEGLMGYEAQIAGVTDNMSHARLKSAVVRTLKKSSLNFIQQKRKTMVNMVTELGHSLRFVNGGGTGSLEETAKEEVVTEVTIGSGFYSPGLFDNYKDFKFNPALFYGLDVTRNPAPHIFTCAGGGHNASGAIESLKAPKIFLPEEASLIHLEGVGEVQTPIKYSGDENLLGSRIFLRHAKAGEVCEYFSDIHGLRNLKREKTFATYRKEGLYPP